MNILGEHQEALCRAFAVSGGDKFEGVGWSPGITGAPVIDNSLAVVECELGDIFDGGDHEIVTGHVVAMEIGEGSPLLFYRGGFGVSSYAGLIPFAPMPELIPSSVIDDVVLVRPDVHGDERGRFVETYRRSWFPERPRDGPGQPLREAGRRAGRPALPPAPGRLLVRPARARSGSSCTTCVSGRAPTGRPRSSSSTATSTRACTSHPGWPTASRP